MARPKKSSNEINKSQAIRDELAASPAASIKDVVATLGSKGIKVSTNLVYAIKARAVVKRKKAKRTAAVATGHAVGMSNAAEMVTHVKTLAKKVGGMNQLKKLVDVLSM